MPTVVRPTTSKSCKAAAVELKLDRYRTKNRKAAAVDRKGRPLHLIANASPTFHWANGAACSYYICRADVIEPIVTVEGRHVVVGGG